jgi:muconolactone delta-isomerase
MEFLVDMVTTVPDGTTSADIEAIRGREAARSRELAAQGHLPATDLRPTPAPPRS